MFDDQQSKHCKEVLRKNNLNPVKKLGKGGFGLVYLVSKTDFTTYETQLFSVKCTSKKNFLKKPILRRYLKQQILLMEGLQHRNIVKLIRTFEDDGWIFMVMEYCNVGNLAYIQNQKENRVFPLEQCKNIVNDIIQGLSYMHEKKIIHRDIKPENILLLKEESPNEETITKICDLGFSRETDEEAETFCGTTYYMAPEIFQKKKYNNKVDIWALGVLIFTMLFGNHPFKGMNMSSEINSKCLKGFDLDNMKTGKNDSISVEDKKMLKQLFRDIFKLDPQQRLGLEEIKDRLSQANFDKKSSQKETIASECSEEEPLEFYLQEIQFIQDTWLEVSELKFLTSMEELALKYYLDKVCLSLLSENSTTYSENNFQLYEKFKKSQTVDSVNLASNLSRVGIKKFSQVFTSNLSTDFKNYKQAYRLVVGHAFYKAHKMIGESKLKNQIKLKLFCCHVINRVFDKAYTPQLFKHYYDWTSDKKKPSNLNLGTLMEWIREEKEVKIVQTVQIINNRFYRKSK